MTAYYNEIDPTAAKWLRMLISCGLIADGVVDERSIEDVRPEELAEFTQCHFFAGIGVWSLALRNSQWPDSRRVWTGSCPCQPFSAAGKGTGFDDERHLWPAFHWLIEQCRPDVVFGEQVVGKAGEAWFDLVSTDLENTGYACGAAVTAACGFGAPHIRKRMYWVGHTNSKHPRRNARTSYCEEAEPPVREVPDMSCSPSPVGSVADTAGHGRQQGGLHDAESPQANECGSVDRPGAAGPTNGFWGDADWLGCRDGKWRPVEPGTFPLADGAPARVGRLRGYGNAIVMQQAQAFITSYLEVTA